MIPEGVLKSGNIVVLKGGSWSKLLKGIFSKDTRNLYLARTLISVVTLSRYTHTATLIQKEDGKWYFVQALYYGGVTETELYLPWFESQIEENKLDVFEDSTFDISKFNNRLMEVLGKKYWVMGIINIGLYNLFGKNKYTDYTDKFFCSHLTTYLHELPINEQYCLNSPADVAGTNILRRII